MKYESLKNKTILITGASKGIGKEIACKLIDSQCKLLLHASSKDSFSDFDLRSDNISFHPFDLSDADKIESGLEEMRLNDLYPDIIINNAGVGYFKNFHDLSVEEFDKMTAINYRAPFLIAKAFIPKMIEKQFGAIVNIVSVAATNNYNGSSVYGASKSAMLEMMKTIRMEVRRKNIKVLNFLPGATNTTIWSEKVRNEHGSKMMQADKLADIIVSTIDLSIINDITTEEIVLRPQNGDL